ncbi:hypothetical protein [Escherichia coli]|uniref:hypothetical protein n=1 Tax=Escherichia coli TaxID=562 RepID=UPI0012FF6AE6|nr:hypothetical protein [Escherichia coli]
MAYIFIFLVAVFSFDSAYAASTIEYLDSTSGTHVAVGSPGGVPCTSGFGSCSGDTFYCSTSYSSKTQIPGMSGYLVTGNWTTYKAYHYEDGVKVYSQCKDSYYGDYLGASYSAKPTEEGCLSRPEINTSLSGSYKDNEGNQYVTIHGCIYKATGVVICPDGTDSCTANWKPVTVDPSYSDKEDTEDKGDSGDTDDKGNNGNTDGGDNSGGSTSGGSSGGSTSGGSSGGSTSGGSSGGSTSGGSSGGSTSGGSSGGSTSGGSSGDDDGWLGDILGWLQRIWSSVNDLNKIFSVSQSDMDNALNSLDNGIENINKNMVSSLPEGDFPLSDLSQYLPGQGSENYDDSNWLTIDLDKLLNTNNGIALPFVLQFSFNLPLIGVIDFKVDTTDFAKAYDYYVRSILEYTLYMMTMLRVFVITRRTLFEREVKS